MTAEEWNTNFAGHWNFAGARQSGHIAMFPEELPKRLIKMFSFVSETVLDPFAGSGTTALASKNLDRNSVGFEINPEFIPIIKEKLEVHQKDLNGTTYEFVKQKETKIDFENEIQKLPYIFKDPHTLDKKIDVKKLQFGSKIDKDSSTQREELFTVKEVISPEKIRLSNDLIIKLIGIKEDPIINEKATTFLTDKTKGKKVFLKYDNVKHDRENNLLCYLYLENKTFINAHLIKNGLVQVDSDTDFKYRNKFQTLFEEANGK
jgi:site-specific DNA-methyltransferase (adenine-specific)